MEIIVLSGYARSGKDEAAKVLVDRFGFVQMSFADKLREMLYLTNPIVKQEQDAYFTRNVNTTYLQEVIDQHGWDGYKETEYGPEVRRLIQRLGTDAGRGVLGEDIWINATLAGLDKNAKVVVSDGRFPNELDAVRRRGGHAWRIERNGVGPANNHPSETEAASYDGFSLHLNNNGSLEEWRELVSSEYTSGRYRK